MSGHWKKKKPLAGVAAMTSPTMTLKLDNGSRVNRPSRDVVGFIVVAAKSGSIATIA